MNEEQAIAAMRMQADYLRDQTEKIIALATSPEVLFRLSAVLSAPRGTQLALASDTLTPAALALANVPLPEGIRISSRYFEEGAATATRLGGFPEPDALPPLPGVPRMHGIPSFEPDDIPQLPPSDAGPLWPNSASRDGPAMLPSTDARSVCVCIGGGGCIGVGGDV